MHGLDRLTANETVVGVLGQRHERLKVRLIFDTSGHALDLDLRPSKLRFHGAKVNVVVGDEEKLRVLQDKGCLYHGSFDEGRGVVSLHFCDARMVRRRRVSSSVVVVVVVVVAVLLLVLLLFFFFFFSEGRPGGL